jgi:signal transduction histidine kinase
LAVELAEVAAGLPVAASLAVAGGITSLREGRRRTALNEAMHELRRPLQVLSLALPEDSAAARPAESALRLTAAALERLDSEINGSTLGKYVTTVPIRRLVEEAVGRWRNAAVLAECELRVRWSGEEALVEGNRFELAQALDNLISNAIEHGGGKVTIEERRHGDWVCLSVCDSGGSSAARRPPRRRGLRGGRCRRGHGLRVVGRVVEAHGGEFSLRRYQHGAEARLRLPLCQKEAQV